MLGSDPNKREVRAIATPVVSFLLLGAMVVGAVIFGNLATQRADDCRPLGTTTKSDSPALIAYSDDHDGLMLCDVPRETVAYVPPDRARSAVRVGDSTYVLQVTYDDRTDDVISGRIQGNDLIKDADRYPPEGQFSYEGNIRRTPVYVKGEYGTLEDCGFFDDLYASAYVSEDFDGFDGPDMFHPDRIQSCWVELETEYYANGG